MSNETATWRPEPMTAEESATLGRAHELVCEVARAKGMDEPVDPLRSLLLLAADFVRTMGIVGGVAAFVAWQAAMSKRPPDDATH